MKKLDETILRTVFDFAYGDKTTGKDPKHTREFFMAVAGPSYLVWFVLLGRRLLQLGRPAGEGLSQSG